MTFAPLIQIGKVCSQEDRFYPPPDKMKLNAGLVAEHSSKREGGDIGRLKEGNGVM
jgi:hypothetical protein